MVSLFATFLSDRIKPPEMTVGSREKVSQAVLTLLWSVWI